MNTILAFQAALSPARLLVYPLVPLALSTTHNALQTTPWTGKPASTPTPLALQAAAGTSIVLQLPLLSAAIPTTSNALPTTPRANGRCASMLIPPAQEATCTGTEPST
jgi:hypothetical protein